MPKDEKTILTIRQSNGRDITSLPVNTVTKSIKARNERSQNALDRLDEANESIKRTSSEQRAFQAKIESFVGDVAVRVS